MFKTYIENMKKRVKLSAEDISDMRVMLSEASAEDQEASKADVEDLAKKQEEQAKADAEAAAAAEAAKVAEEAKKAEETQLSEKNGMVSLAEHNKVKMELASIKLGEEVEGTLMCSEKNATGFRPDAKAEVIGFMLSLSDTQRVAFKGLMTKLSSVDFSVKGKGADEAVNVQLNSEAEYEEKVIALSSKYNKEGMSPADAQKRAMAEVPAPAKK